jgi:hypothetical protein
MQVSHVPDVPSRAELTKVRDDAWEHIHRTAELVRLLFAEQRIDGTVYGELIGSLYGLPKEE